MPIIRKAIASLIPYDANPRTHPTRQVDQLATLIKKFGFHDSHAIAVDEDGVIIWGHGRLLAAQKAGLTDVPVEVLTGLSEEDKRALRIADNSIAEQSDWDMERLQQELDALNQEGYSLELLALDDSLLEELGGMFDPGEGGFGEGGEDELDGFGDEDAVPEIEDEVEPVAKRGDVWRLGRHRVMCGDSAVAGDVARLMDGEQVDCIVTDPPYGIGIAANPVRQKHQKQEWDNTPADPSFLLQENVPTIIWGGNYFDLPPAKGFLVWDKKQPEDFTLAMCEQAWTNIDTPAKMFRLSVTSYSKQHPTQKPVELLEWCLKYAAGKIVLDPFGGSGSTLIAAENAGRDCRIMEISPRYVDVIIQRWEDYTGGKAELYDGV